MGGVPDQEQPRTVPPRAAARLDREQRDLPPVLEMLHAIGELRDQLGEGLLERFNTGGAQLRVGALGDDVASLPVVEAVQHDRDMTSAEAAHQTLEILWLAGQLEPEYVHGRGGLDR